MPRWVWVIILLLCAWMLIDPNSLADFLKLVFNGVVTFAQELARG